MHEDMKARVTDTEGVASVSSPELRAFHDQIFVQAALENRDIYGSSEGWSTIKRSGHFRRMAILAAADLQGIEQKTVVDFGTGPWGFACVFPKLRHAAKCIGMDVSLKALELAAARDEEIASKTTYFTSDGETIPLDDDVVDVFWGGEVIEHVREPRRFLQEVARVCKDGARVLLSTPNRDAVYYLANGEEYSIGPEHIALLNYDELVACLGRFFDPIRVVGYETSLRPDIDVSITDESAATLIQERAYQHPRSASGLIVDGVVRKDLYKANCREWRLEERLWSDAGILGIADAEKMRLFGEVHGAGLSPRSTVHLSISGNYVIVLFWAHDWSGRARVEVAGVERIVDLYSPLGGFRRLEMHLPDLGVHSVRITRIGEKRACAVADQVIFYKVIAYAVS